MIKEWTHDFDGGCDPKNGGPNSYRPETFSVGIFQWVQRGNGKCCKRNSVKVRVKGRYDNPEPVYAKARQIAAELDDGTYTGPKRVTVHD